MTRRKKVDVYGEPTTPEVGGILVPQANGRGALKQGGRHPNSGPPRAELRAEMRGSVRVWWPRIAKLFPEFSHADKLKAVDLAARYGLGMLTQQLTPAAVEEQVQVLGTTIIAHLREAGFSQEAAENFMASVVADAKRQLEG